MIDPTIFSLPETFRAAVVKAGRGVQGDYSALYRALLHHYMQYPEFQAQVETLDPVQLYGEEIIDLRLSLKTEIWCYLPAFMLDEAMRSVQNTQIVSRHDLLRRLSWYIINHLEWVVKLPDPNPEIMAAVVRPTKRAEFVLGSKDLRQCNFQIPQATLETLGRLSAKTDPIVTVSELIRRGIHLLLTDPEICRKAVPELPTPSGRHHTEG